MPDGAMAMPAAPLKPGVPRGADADERLDARIRRLELSLSLDRMLPALPSARVHSDRRAPDRWATIDDDDEEGGPAGRDSDRPRSWWTALVGGGRLAKDRPAANGCLASGGSPKRQARPGERSPPAGTPGADPPGAVHRSGSAQLPPSRKWAGDPHSPQMPAILVNSRGSSATDFSSGRASYASLPSSPRTGTLSNAALQAFRGDEIKSLSGLTLFGDSEGELAALQRNLPPSSSGSDPQPSAAQHSKGTANGKALPPKLVLNSDLSSGKLAAIKESAADAEDRERNSRHREVVELQNGTRPLPPEFVSQYRIGELLGDGAFGFVMTATCLKTGKEVAVKFILREKIASELWTVDPRFGRLPMEVHVLSSLDHPNIVKYLGHFSDADRFIMVTELHGTQWHADNHELNSNRNPGLLKETPTSPHLEGSAAAECSPLHRLTPEQERKIKRRVPCDLFQCIDAHSRLLDSTCRYIFAQIALAVHYMHSKGFIHRDLKDENVVVDADYNVKLIDFGSAARIPRTPDEYFTYSKFNGTLHFAAPEICRRQPYRGPEAEVWSLGVLLFIMVFAESPFATRDDTIKGQFRFPRSDVDPACADLIRRMLTYDEKARITIDEILEHEWLKTDIVSLRRSGRQ